MDLQHCMRVFIEVVNGQSFSTAARKMHRSHSHISKAIKYLEEELNIPLLVRTTRKISVTPEGEHFYRYATHQLDQYKNLKALLQQQHSKPHGKLTVSMPKSCGASILCHHIHKFMLAYPQIELDILYENRFVNAIDEQIDVVIRADHSTNSSYHCHPFLPSQHRVYASPDCLKKLGTPTHPNQLANFPCLLHSDTKQPNLWIFKNKLTVAVKERYRCNSVSSIVNATADGLGCAYLNQYNILLNQYLENGQLTEILMDFVEPPRQLYIGHPKTLFTAKKVTAFINYLIEHCQATQAK